MLKNKFRMLIGVLILSVFGLAVYRFAVQTSGNEFVWGALASGMKLVLFLAVVLGAVYLFDRRMKKRSPEK